MHQIQIIHFTNSKPLIKLGLYMEQDEFLSGEYFLSSREQRKRLSGNRLRFIKSGQSANS